MNLLFASKSYEFDLKNKILSTENFERGYEVLNEKTVENEQNQVKIDFNPNQQGLLLHKNRMYIPNIE